MELLNPLEILKNPKHSSQIQDAVNQQKRLKFHAEIVSDKSKQPYHQEFISWVSSFVTAKDKRAMFEKMLTYPLKTNEVVETIADDYLKVFNSQNSFKRISFKNSNLDSDFSDFNKSLNIESFMRDEVFDAIVKAPSSVLVVDLPTLQQSKYPEPYFYLLDIESVHDIDLDNKGNVNYICFKDSKSLFILLDAQFYRAYKKDNDEFALVAESQHDLGFCPAKIIVNDSLNKTNKVNKLSPISSLIGGFDWLLFLQTAKQNLDLYGAYPVYWSLASKCGYHDNEGNECRNGIITKYDVVAEKDVVTKCPACASNSLVAPGSLIEKPVPVGNNSIESGAPLGIVSIDRSSLDYNVDECERVKDALIASATGKTKLLQKEAVNELQVEGQFEKQSNILNWLARNLEQDEKWLVDTICLLRYGRAVYGGSEISYGTEFYLESEDGAIKDFDESKKAGLPTYILMSKLEAIENAKSKGNHIEKERLRLLRHLEPYPDLSVDECKTNGIDSIDKEGFVLKLNFANFVSKFEAKYGNIVEFGSLLTFDKKLEVISNAFHQMAQPFLNSAPPSNELRSTVGGLTGMIEIIKAVSEGFYSLEGAIALVADRFNLTEEEAKKQIGTIKSIKTEITN